MNGIPKIIHQIWSDKYKPLPNLFLTLSQTWKNTHSDWEYIYWNEEKMENFVKEEFPEYDYFYHSFPFDM